MLKTIFDCLKAEVAQLVVRLRRIPSGGCGRKCLKRSLIV
jgi:hypothetical protein